MKISIRKVLNVFLCFFTMIITNLFFVYFNSQNVSIYVWQRNISIITIIFIIMSILIVKKAYSFFSFPVLFIVLSYLFHFGQIIINGMFPDHKYSAGTNFVPQYADSIVKESIHYSFLTIQFVVIGIIIGKKDKICNLNIPCISQNMEECKRVAKIILCLTLPFKIGITIVQIFFSYTYGYASQSSPRLINIKGFGIMHTLASLYILGIFLLLCYYRNSPHSFQKVYIVACIIGIFSMFSGSRSRGVLEIICFTCFYLLLSNKIDVKKILKLTILGFIVGLITIAIATTRLTAKGVGFSALYTYIIEIIKDNKVITNALEEFGGTVSSILKVVEQENIFYLHQYGISYIKGIISIFPNLRYDFSKLLYTNYLNHNGGMGGSYIAEFYFNFGKYSYILGIILGIAVVRVYDCFISYIRDAKYIKASYLVPMLYEFLFLPRDYILAIYRTIVWGILIIYFLHIIKK